MLQEDMHMSTNMHVTNMCIQTPYTTTQYKQHMITLCTHLELVLNGTAPNQLQVGFNLLCQRRNPRIPVVQIRRSVLVPCIPVGKLLGGEHATGKHQGSQALGGKQVQVARRVCQQLCISVGPDKLHDLGVAALAVQANGVWWWHLWYALTIDNVDHTHRLGPWQ